MYLLTVLMMHAHTHTYMHTCTHKVGTQHIRSVINIWCVHTCMLHMHAHTQGGVHNTGHWPFSEQISKVATQNWTIGTVWMANQF